METNDVFITLLPFSYQIQQIPAVSQFTTDEEEHEYNNRLWDQQFKAIGKYSH